MQNYGGYEYVNSIIQCIDNFTIEYLHQMKVFEFAVLGGGDHMLIDTFKATYKELNDRKSILQQYIAMEDLQYSTNELCNELEITNDDIKLLKEIFQLKGISF